MTLSAFCAFDVREANPNRIILCETSQKLPGRDHLVVYVTNSAVLPRRGHQSNTLWKFNKTDLDHLANLAHLGPWCMTTTGKDPLGNFDLWCDLSEATEEECVPFCTRFTRRKYPPCITPDLMRAARRKRALLKKTSRTKDSLLSRSRRIISVP